MLDLTKKGALGLVQDIVLSLLSVWFCGLRCQTDGWGLVPGRVGDGVPCSVHQLKVQVMWLCVVGYSCRGVTGVLKQ